MVGHRTVVVIELGERHVTASLAHEDKIERAVVIVITPGGCADTAARHGETEIVEGVIGAGVVVNFGLVTAPDDEAEGEKIEVAVVVEIAPDGGTIA